VVLSLGQQPLVGGLIISEASRSHLDTTLSVELLWTLRPLLDNAQHSQETDTHASGGIGTHNPSKRSTADPRLTPSGHSDRQMQYSPIELKFLASPGSSEARHKCSLSLDYSHEQPYPGTHSISCKRYVDLEFVQSMLRPADKWLQHGRLLTQLPSPLPRHQS